MRLDDFGYLLFLSSIGLLLASTLIRVLRKSSRRSGMRTEDTDLVVLGESALPHVVDPSGGKLLLSVGPAKQPLPEPNDAIQAIAPPDMTRKYTCGHSGPERYRLNVYGSLTKNIHGERYCPDCMIQYVRKRTVRCALCGLPIYPDDAVALYHESSEGLPYRDRGHRIESCYLGCLRWDCCPSYGFFAGHWTENGYQPAF